MQPPSEFQSPALITSKNPLDKLAINKQPVSKVFPGYQRNLFVQVIGLRSPSLAPLHIAIAGRAHELADDRDNRT